MFKIKYKSKIRKFIYNAIFWLSGVLIISLFLGILIYIWSKFNFIVEHKYVSSKILSFFNFGIYFFIAFSVIGFILNMFVFYGEVNKVIDKEYYRKVAIVESILFLLGIIMLVLSPILLKASNLAFDDYKMKTVYCLFYCSTFMSAFFCFYLFSLFNVISEDESYNKAKPYVYRINKLNYKEICRLIVKKIGDNCKIGNFLNTNYNVDYYINHGDDEHVYAFINLKKVSDDFLKLYMDDRLLDFVEYLYAKALDKKKKTKIMYFICIDEFDDNFKSLIDLSIYQDEHFSVVHTLIDLKNNDLYIGGVRDDKKTNVYDYATLKEEVVRVLENIIEKS